MAKYAIISLLCLGSLTALGFMITKPSSMAASNSSIIVTNNHWASEAASLILSKGGNAIDAAIAAGFVLSLTEPGSSGIGGGGYALTLTASNRQKWAYDGRETAPHTASSAWFLDQNGRPLDFEQAVLSAKSVGVPAEVALFYRLHKERGKLPWNQLPLPAALLARRGFPISPLLHQFLSDHARILIKNPDIKKIFFKGDRIKDVGSQIKNPVFAETLMRIAENPGDFYHGKLADEIIADINHAAKSTLFNRQDFSDYQIRRYPAICTDYRSRYRICSVPPSSSGGITVQELLGIYALRYQGHQYSNPEWMYYFLEASKLAYADRNQYLADPAFEKQPVSGLLSKAYWRERASTISLSARATPVAAGFPAGARKGYGPDDSIKTPGTTSIAIADSNGNAISMTLTIEGPFGSHLFTHGFFLNNELTDFSFTATNKKGLRIANAVAAGKRPRSSMAPVMVFKNNGQLYALSGSPGGSEIICYVAKNLILMLDMNMSPAAAGASPNLCALNTAPVIENTEGPFPAASALRAMGEQIVREDMLSGVTNILRSPGGAWLGAADPRREGVVLKGR